MTHIELFLDVSVAILLTAILVNRWLDDRRAMYQAHQDYLFHALCLSDESEDACQQQENEPDKDAQSGASAS